MQDKTDQNELLTQEIMNRAKHLDDYAEQLDLQGVNLENLKKQNSKNDKSEELVNKNKSLNQTLLAQNVRLEDSAKKVANLKELFRKTSKKFKTVIRKSKGQNF